MPAPIQVGIIGYGSSVKNYHYPYISSCHDILHLRAVLQRSTPSADGAAGHITIDHPEVIHYRTKDSFFADKEIELVIICTRVESHAELALAAIRAGKHVVVEKAFTPTTEEADEVIAAARKAGVILTVYQNRRYDADFQTLQKLFDQHVFGTINEAEFHHDLNSPPMLHKMTEPTRSPGEGMIYTAGSHSLDQALRLFGRPSSVTGFLRVLRGIESSVEDTFTITMGYEPNPLIVHVKTNAVSTMPYPLTFFIRGSEGSFVKFGSDQQNVHIRQGLLPGSADFGKEPEEAWGQLATRKRVSETQMQRGELWWGKVPSQQGDWRRFYVDLVMAIRGEKPLVIDPQTSRDGVKVIQLAIESAERGCTMHWA